MVLFPAAANQSTVAAPERRLTGYVMDNDSLRDAVTTWLSDATGAEATYGHISTWDTGGVTDMQYLFCADAGCCCGGSTHYNLAASSFNEDISAWDTSGVTTMRAMFRSTAFNQDISAWDTSDVWTMEEMFVDAPFNQPIGSWSVSNVRDMSGMFYRASDFNQPLGDWSVDALTTMNWMFLQAWRFNQPIGNWRVDNVRSMHTTFSQASWFNSDISGWNVDQVIIMTEMFSWSGFNQDISGWNVDRVTSMQEMFNRATNFNQDLGWCKSSSVFDPYNYGYDIHDAFYSTKCEATACGVCVDGVYLTLPPTQRPTTPAPTSAPTFSPRPTLAPSDSRSSSSSGTVIPLFAWALVAVWIMICGGCIWFARRQHLAQGRSGGVDSPPKRLEPPKARPEEEAAVISVAPEAEETRSETSVEQPPQSPAKSWFWRAEPTAPDPESIAPKAEEAEQPPPLSPFSALRAERERELAPLEPEFEPES